ncbi:hypothetical protein AAHA92_16763 [Salvia divinorum]|uniref:Uncharacterized protein n=1 Tax=Salvia divinorum TaxID=28513 RepID=A0ABD1GWK6_SALDI
MSDASRLPISKPIQLRSRNGVSKNGGTATQVLLTAFTSALLMTTTLLIALTTLLTPSKNEATPNFQPHIFLSRWSVKPGTGQKLMLRGLWRRRTILASVSMINTWSLLMRSISDGSDFNWRQVGSGAKT